MNTVTHGLRPIIRPLVFSALVLMVLSGSANAQLFEQQFTGPLTAGNAGGGTIISNTSVTMDSLYVNSTSPLSSQFTFLSNNNVVDSIEISGDGFMRLTRPGSGTIYVVRNANFTSSPSALMVSFDHDAERTAGTSGGAIEIMLGQNFTNSNVNPSTTNKHSLFYINTKSPTGTPGTWGVTPTSASSTSAFNTTERILWVTNNSNGTLSYHGADGATHTVANDTYDLWVGDSLLYDNQAANSDTAALNNFEIRIAGGNGTHTVDNLLIDPIPATPTSLPAGSISSTQFTANWNSVTGVTGYRLDVATDSGFTSFVTGYENLYVAGQGTGSHVVTGLASSTTYYYRVRAASQYVAGEFGSGSSNIEAATTTGGGIVLPTVTTAAITDITATSATGGGEVTSNGGGTVSARGIVWNTTGTPTLADSFTVDGAGVGTFVSSLSGLAPSSTYYVRAYATNEAGTGYGNGESFATLGVGTILSNGTGGGDWNIGSTWVGGIVPTSSNDAVIVDGDSVYLLAGGTCDSLALQSGAKLALNASSLVIPGSTWSFDVTSTVYYNNTTTVQSAPVYGNLVYSAANGGPNGNLTVNGNLTITTATMRGISATTGSRTHTVAGNVIIGPGTSARISAVNSSASTDASCTWNIGGDVTLTGNASGNRMMWFESAGPHSGTAIYSVAGDLSLGTSSILEYRSSSGAIAYGTGILNLQGDLLNNGGTIRIQSSGTAGTWTFNLDGTTPQTVVQTGAMSISSLTLDININNPSGVILGSPLEVPTNTTLLLVDGILTTTDASLLSVGNGSLVGGSDTSYVYGPMSWMIPTGSPSRNFPVGDAGNYTPVSVQFGTVTLSGFLKVTTVGTEHPQIAASGINPARSLNRYYILQDSLITFDTCNAVFNFGSTDVDPGANPLNFIARRYFLNWSDLTVGTRTATSTQVTGATGFGDFAFGEAVPTPSTVVSNGTGGGEWSSGTTWVGGVPPTFVDTVLIVGSDSVYVGTEATCEVVTVPSGAKLGLFATLSVEHVTLNGRITVHADTLQQTSMTVGSTGMYVHARNGGRLPIADWGTGSTIMFTGITSNSPSNGNQNFHDVIWNCPNQSSNLNLGWNENTIGGNINVVSTGTGRWQMCAPTATDTSIVTIMGDVIQTGGTFTTNGTGNGLTTVIINQHGNIVTTGGNLSISRGSQGGTGTATWNLLNGNLSIENATTQNSNVAGAKFVMAKNGPQTVSLSNDSLGSSSAIPIHVNSGITTMNLSNINYANRGFPVQVNSGGTLVMDTSVFAGNGTFTLAGGAQLSSGHPDGLNGNLATTGAIMLSTNAAYAFSGTSLQVTGVLLPDTVMALAINNTAGVILSGGTTINNILVVNGYLDLNGDTVHLSSTALLMESPGKTVRGAAGVITTTRVLTAPSDTVDIAGLGVRIGSAANLGSTVITRGHAPQTTVPNRIHRYFDITPANNTGLNATFKFRYDDSELNGQVESTLKLFRSTDNGTTWVERGGAVDTAANTIMLTAVGEFSRWTAASVTLPPLPAQVVLVSPAHGATINADSALCVWQQSSPVVTHYWFERAGDSLFTLNVVRDSTLTDTSTVTRGLVTNQTYWWRVRARNAAGWGPYSTARRFVVMITGVDELALAPLEFSLKQNYPNPFNPSTTIKFSVEQTGHATIEVFNLLGQKVLTLFDGTAEAGRYHTVILRGDNLPTGIYFYRLQNGQKSDLKKLMLLK